MSHVAKLQHHGASPLVDRSDIAAAYGIHLPPTDCSVVEHRARAPVSAGQVVAPAEVGLVNPQQKHQVMKYLFTAQAKWIFYSQVPGSNGWYALRCFLLFPPALVPSNSRTHPNFSGRRPVLPLFPSYERATKCASRAKKMPLNSQMCQDLGGCPPSSHMSRNCAQGTSWATAFSGSNLEFLLLLP